MESLYNIYTNINTLLVKYRKYKCIDPFCDFNEFKKQTQNFNHIIQRCIDPITQKKIHVYLLTEESDIIKTTSKFKRTFSKIKDNVKVILITKSEVSIYIYKVVNTFNAIDFNLYLYKNFLLEISKGPLCSKHSIISKQEVQKLCKMDLIINPLSLPSISINDPQNIWIGGELGQIIKIESYSEIAGKAIRYRIISPDSGKMNNLLKISNKILKNKEITKTKDILNNHKDSDDDIKDSDDDIKDSDDDIKDSDDDIKDSDDDIKDSDDESKDSDEKK